MREKVETFADVSEANAELESAAEILRKAKDLMKDLIRSSHA